VAYASATLIQMDDVGHCADGAIIQCHQQYFDHQKFFMMLTTHFHLHFFTPKKTWFLEKVLLVLTHEFLVLYVDCLEAKMSSL